MGKLALCCWAHSRRRRSSINRVERISAGAQDFFLSLSPALHWVRNIKQRSQRKRRCAHSAAAAATRCCDRREEKIHSAAACIPANSLCKWGGMCCAHFQPPLQFATGELIHLALFGKLTPLHHCSQVLITEEQRSTHRCFAEAERNFRAVLYECCQECRCKFN